MASYARKCVQCKAKFSAERRTARYCSPNCRARASEQRRREERKAADRLPPVKLAVGEDGASLGLVASVEAELTVVGKLHTVIGQQAIALARRMEDDKEPGAALAAVSRELRTAMALAGRGAESDDPVDELKAKRDAKRSQASASR